MSTTGLNNVSKKQMEQLCCLLCQNVVCQISEIVLGSAQRVYKINCLKAMLTTEGSVTAQAVPSPSLPLICQAILYYSTNQPAALTITPSSPLTPTLNSELWEIAVSP